MRNTSNTLDDLRLVQEVYKYPTLYDSRQRGYKDRPMKCIAWQTIADALDMQVIETKNRWRYIRDRFVREKKLLLNEGEEAYQRKDPWPLLDELSFLWEFITHRKQVPSDEAADGSATDAVPAKKRKAVRALQPILPRPSPEWVNVTLDYDDSGESTPCDTGFNQEHAHRAIPCDVEIKEEHPQSQRESLLGEPESQLRRLLEDRISEVDELHPLEDDNMDDSSEAKRSVCKDEDELYCLSVAAAFKRFSPKMKALAKWKIQQVLYDVEFNQPGSSNPQNFSVLPH